MSLAFTREVWARDTDERAIYIEMVFSSFVPFIHFL